MTELEKLTIIEAEVCDYLRVDAARLHLPHGKREVTEARFAIFWLAKIYTNLTLEAIGGYFCDMDHASVLHGRRVIDNLIRYNGWRAKSETLRGRIGRRIHQTSYQIDMDAWCRAMGGMVTNYQDGAVC